MCFISLKSLRSSSIKSILPEPYLGISWNQGLSDEEAVSYIIHKLECAGAARTVVDETAMRAVAGHAHGNPRLIDNIMNDAVTIGAQSNKTTIDTEVILAVVNNQNLG